MHRPCFVFSGRNLAAAHKSVIDVYVHEHDSLVIANVVFSTRRSSREDGANPDERRYFTGGTLPERNSASRTGAN